ncbi:cation:proton antiporter [Streptomyces sp. NPDC097619]|uniref:cation:proton antiporter n=1 Tax=Streptomyces sp. NPDC097619 TaxID=3157228 RepID=UPI003320BCD9
MTLSDAVYLAMGLVALGAAVLPRLLFRRPLSMPMVFLAAGMVAASLPGVPAVRPGEDRLWVEHATELCVIVSLMGAGLALNRPVGWRSWAGPWRLLGVAMPLTIAVAAVVAAPLLGWPVASAVLLAAVLSPTDPVLASEVRVGEPSEAEDDEDEVRFSLTAEAGLNDGLAFPFVLGAIALASAVAAPSAQVWPVRWFAVDLLARVAIGIAVGFATGRLLGRMFFRARPSALRLSEHMEGFVALGATFAAYGATELLHGYGFLAVFVTACTIRAAERGHGYHRVLHGFTEQVERLLTAFLLFLLGGYLATEGWAHLTWRGAVFALVLVLVVRPLTAWLSLVGAAGGPRERLVTAAFGIRGIGSLFYLAYALGHSPHFAAEAPQLWSLTAFTVLLSVLVHGVAATPVIRRLDHLRDSSASPP